MLAMRSGWVNSCAKKVDDLTRGKALFAEEDKVRREYDREIRQWKRKLFWAKYGYIRAATIGVSLGGVSGYFLIPLLPF